MTMISYAQNAEDVLLNRLFPAAHKGFYIDIGAAHPTGHSVTRFFYGQGWRGINVEPVPSFFRLIEEERPRDVNLRLAISDRSGTLTFHHAERSEGESTLSAQEADALRARGLIIDCFEVEAVTLRDLCETYVPEGTEIDFLKIDVEHHEDAVIRGADWNRWRPRVLVIEADKDTSWEPLLLESGYLYAANDGINRYYVREEDRALLPLLEKPANWLDQYVPYEHLAPRLAAEAERDAARGELHSARGELLAVRGELEFTQRDRTRIHTELAHHVSERQSLEARLRESLDEAAAHREELSQSRERIGRLGALVSDLTNDLESERSHREHVERLYSDLLAKVTLEDGMIPGPAMIAIANRLRGQAAKYPHVASRFKRMFKAG